MARRVLMESSTSVQSTSSSLRDKPIGLLFVWVIVLGALTRSTVAESVAAAAGNEAVEGVQQRKLMADATPIVDTLGDAESKLPKPGVRVGLGAGAGKAKSTELVKRPLVWMDDDQTPESALEMAFEIFTRFGYMKKTREYQSWEVVWTKNDPFGTTFSPPLTLEPYQKINHFPSMPDILGRGDLGFVESIPNPLLIDGRMFEIDTFVGLLSLNPLRVYLYEPDWNVRFCSQSYDRNRLPAENAECFQEEVNTVGMDKVPSLNLLWEMKYTAPESLYSYLRKTGMNWERIKTEMHHRIQEIFLKLENDLLTAARLFSSERSFFELLQITFLVDENFGVQVKQITPSPELHGAESHPLRYLHQHVTFAFLSMAGLRRHFNQNDGNFSDPNEGAMHVSMRDLSVYLDACLSDECTDNCKPMLCGLCHPCMSDPQLKMLKTTFIEHVARYGFRRVFPVPFEDQDAAAKWDPETDTSFQSLSPANRFLSLWFKDKCRLEAAWCR